MKNPTLAIACAPCGVPIAPVLHPKPDTVISCPQCGTAEPYSEVWAGCMSEIAQRLRRMPTDDAKWRFRAGPPPVTASPDQA